MNRNIKAFAPGIVFESNTTYIGDQKEYHIYPGDGLRKINKWNRNPGPDDPFSFAPILLENVENVTIDLGGAKLIYHGRHTPVAAFGCKNITMKNFSIDYDRPFYTQGTITDVDTGSLVIDIPEAFPYRIERGTIVAESEFWENGMDSWLPLLQAYKPDTLKLSDTPCILAVIGDNPEIPVNPPCPVYYPRAEQLAGRKVRLSNFPDFFTPKKGEILAFGHEPRTKHGFLLEKCSDLTFENIRLLHISSLAVVANLCHNMTFRNFSCYVDDESNGRVISVIADILHGYHCTGKILVEDCRFENMLDDALNFHGNYTVCDAPGDRHSFITYNKCRGLMGMTMYLPGDKLHVYRGSTQELKAVYTVEDAGYLPGDVYRQRITVRESVHDFAPGDIVESQRMPEMTIRRCTSGRCRGGWRLSSALKTVMEDCRIENSTIMLTGDTDYWYENTGVRDLTIQNCTFENFAGPVFIAGPVFEATEKAPYYHSGVRILNNTFIDCRGDIMRLNHTRDVVFAGSRYIDDGTAPHSVTLNNCSGVSISE